MSKVHNVFESLLTDWTGLEHQFPNESVGTTLIQVSLNRVGVESVDQEDSTYEVHSGFLIPIILWSGHERDARVWTSRGRQRRSYLVLFVAFV